MIGAHPLITWSHRFLPKPGSRKGDLDPPPPLGKFKLIEFTLIVNLMKIATEPLPHPPKKNHNYPSDSHLMWYYDYYHKWFLVKIGLIRVYHIVNKRPMGHIVYLNNNSCIFLFQKFLDITCYNYYKTPIIFPRFYNTLNNT